MKSHTLARLLLSSSDKDVFMMSDADGNSYSPLHAPQFSKYYLPEGMKIEDNTLAERNGTEELPEGAHPVVMLHPMY